MVAAVPHADFIQRGTGDLVGLVLVHLAGNYKALGHVLQRGLVGEQVVVLEHKTGAAAQGVNLGVGDAAQLHLLAVKDHGARIGMLQKVHAAQKRCFAAAAGAEDGHDIALLDIEIDAP